MTNTPPRPAASPMLRMAIDYGPLVVFFAVNMLTPGPAIARVMAATASFMVAILIALAVSLWKTRHVSPMLWVTSVLVIVFGGLTLWFHDDTFIKVKPTIVYSMFAVVLVFGLITGRPILQAVLGTAYPGLTERGWRLLTVNWAIFFTVMAVLNEIVWRTQSWNFWVGFKLWGVVPLTLLFGLANVPMLLKNGLTLDDAKDAPIPPEG